MEEDDQVRNGVIVRQRGKILGAGKSAGQPRSEALESAISARFGVRCANEKPPMAFVQQLHLQFTLNYLASSNIEISELLEGRIDLPA